MFTIRILKNLNIRNLNKKVVISELSWMQKNFRVIK